MHPMGAAAVCPLPPEKGADWQWASSCLLQLFCWHILESFRVGLCSPTQRIGLGHGGHCQFYAPLPPPVLPPRPSWPYQCCWNTVRPCLPWQSACALAFAPPKDLFTPFIHFKYINHYSSSICLHFPLPHPHRTKLTLKRFLWKS